MNGMMITQAAGGAVRDKRAKRLINAAINVAGRYLWLFVIIKIAKIGHVGLRRR
jgi:hypothetical protein